jgi:hypothetical protein
VQREVTPLRGAPLTPREQLLGALAPALVAAIEALVEDAVERRLAQPGRIFLTVSEYAGAAGLSSQAIYRQIRRGNLVATRVGGRLLLRVDQGLDGNQTSRGSVPNEKK